MPFQSELTHHVAKEILSNGTCELTEFNESSHLHKLFLQELIEYQKTSTIEKINYCNIT